MSAALPLSFGATTNAGFGMNFGSGSGTTSYNNTTSGSSTYQGQGTQTNQVQGLTSEEQQLATNLAKMSGPQYGSPAYINALKQLGSLVNGGMQASPEQLTNLHNIMQNSISSTQNALNYNMTNPHGTLNAINQQLNSTGMTDSSVAPWMMGGALQQENSALAQAADTAASNYETAAVNTPYQTAGVLSNEAGLGQSQQSLNTQAGGGLLGTLFSGNLANKTTTNNTSGSSTSKQNTTGTTSYNNNSSGMSFSL